MATASDFQTGNQDSVINDWFNLAAQEIYKTYNHKVLTGRKALHKFGRHIDLGTSEGVINHDGIVPVKPAVNDITHYSSANDTDDDVLHVEGMTIASGVLTFVTQDITLQGFTSVELDTPLARVTRIANLVSPTDTVGDVYIYQDAAAAITDGVPDDLATVGNIMSSADQASLYAGTSIQSTNYFIVTNIYAYVGKQTSASVDIKFKIRDASGTFRTVTVADASNNSPADRNILPFYIIPPNSDITMLATSSAVNTDVSAGFSGFFADIIA